MDQYDQIEKIFKEKTDELERVLRKAATESVNELNKAAFSYTEMLQFSQDVLHILDSEKDIDLSKVDPDELYEKFSNEMFDRDVTLKVIWDILQDIYK